MPKHHASRSCFARSNCSARIPPTTRSGSVAGYQNQLIELYLDQNEVAKAQAIFDALSDKERKASGELSVILAVRSNRLQALLDTWYANPDSVPKDAFGSAIYRLMKPMPAYKPHLAAIRPLQEFIFDYKRQTDKLQPTDFPALAQLRIDAAGLPDANAWGKLLSSSEGIKR